MGFDHAMSFTAVVREDVPVARIDEALEALYDSWGYPKNTLAMILGGKKREVELYNGHEFTFDANARELYVCTGGNVSTGFGDTLDATADSLNGIVSEAGYIKLSNYDTAALETAVSKYLFGPSVDAIRNFRFDLARSEAMDILKEFIADTDELDQAIKDAAMIGEPYTVKVFTAQERNTLLAALRYYQQQGMGEPANRSLDIHDLATGGDEQISMDDEGIDSLCYKINS